MANAQPGQPVAVSPQQALQDLKDGGMPIKAIAEAVGLERRAVYALLDGATEFGEDGRRLQAVHRLLARHERHSVADIYRFWYSSLAGGPTLRDLLSAEELDAGAILEFLDSLRLPVLTDEQKRKIAARSGEPNPFVNELPVVSICGDPELDGTRSGRSKRATG